jgi:hypothetical protein
MYNNMKKQQNQCVQDRAIEPVCGAESGSQDDRGRAQSHTGQGRAQHEVEDAQGPSIGRGCTGAS